MPEVNKGSLLVCREDLIPDHALKETDADEFEYEPIAAQIAELLASGTTPLNVALFGPWGSGKSSFGELLRRNLEGRPREAKLGFVSYEAWRYAGESLKRHFIGHLADQLGFSSRRYPQYYRGLYEERKTAELSWRRSLSLALSVAGVLVLGLALLLCLWAVADAVQAAVDNESFRSAFRESASGLVDSFLKGSIAIAAVSALLPLMRVEVQRSAPSADEEFFDRFDDLVEDARTKKDVHRLVVFIDELDRCPADDVVEILTSIKTFLGSTKCVFIVAADRQVVEQALRDKLQQATAVNIEQPYYTSASSFIEKIFQHQVSLPPLRGERLTSFAIKLMAAREGIWADIRSESATHAERVAVALVPSHIRSPRQIKQLLNNFATSIRIAQARGLKHLERAEEIAKLTVLESEFPSFANAMKTDLRLQRLLASPDLLRFDQLPEALADIRAIATKREPEHDATVTEQARPVSALLVGTPTELRETQFDELMRYLHRTASVRGPRSDLFHLGPVAPDLDPNDPTLGETLELLATDVPEEAARALAGRPEPVVMNAISYLARMLDKSYADERENVMTTLAALSEGLGSEWLGPLRPSYSPVRAYALANIFTQSQFIGALRIALAGEGAAGGPVAELILRNANLWLDGPRAKKVIDMTPALSGSALNIVATATADSLGHTADLMQHLLVVIPLNKWQLVADLSTDAITSALGRTEKTSSDGELLANQLLDAVAERTDDRNLVGTHVLNAILEAGLDSTYPVAKGRLGDFGHGSARD